jgi:hypothetical protein
MDGTGIGSRVHGSLAIPAPVINEPAYFKYAGFAFKAASNGVDRRQLARSLISPTLYSKPSLQFGKRYCLNL